MGYFLEKIICAPSPISSLSFAFWREDASILSHDSSTSHVQHKLSAPEIGGVLKLGEIEGTNPTALPIRSTNDEAAQVSFAESRVSHCFRDSLTSRNEPFPAVRTCNLSIAGVCAHYSKF